MMAPVRPTMSMTATKTSAKPAISDTVPFGIHCPRKSPVMAELRLATMKAATSPIREMTSRTKPRHSDSTMDSPTMAISR